jgi:hypothetical protein
MLGFAISIDKLCKGVWFNEVVKEFLIEES